MRSRRKKSEGSFTLVRAKPGATVDSVGNSAIRGFQFRGITGLEVRGATAEVETITGAVTQTFASGSVVQVFLLARSIPADTWSENGLGDQS